MLIRPIALFFLSFQFCATVQGQSLSSMGDISTAEFGLTQCSFDKDADAVVLLHEAEAGYDDTRELVTMHHIRIKILKEKGISEADIKIPFYIRNDFEQIDKVEGLTFNTGPNGEVLKEKLDKKLVYTKQINERYSEVIFVMPDVKVGSIIEYRYRSTMKNYGGLDYWNFQETLPVMLSRYLLTILPNTEFAYRINKRTDLDVKVKPDKESGKIYFEMSNIPGLRNEAYMDARKDYIQKVIFQLSGYNGFGIDKKNFMTSWDEVNNELVSSEEFGMQLKKNLEAPDLDARVKAFSTPAKKMKEVYDYVRSHMVWNGVYSKFSPDGVKQAWKKGRGTSGDINLVLVNMLSAAGLDAFPMLVSERFYGKVNTDYPFIDQFNSVYACVTIDNRNYYLDATDQTCPSHITPYDILNTTAFIVKRKAGRLINIINDSLQFREQVIAYMELGDGGTVEGNMEVQSWDYARSDKLEKYKADTSQFKMNYFPAEGQPLHITRMEVRNRDNDSLPLEQEFDFNTVLNSTGEYKYLSLNFLPGFNRNPFLSDDRFSNVNFGYSRNIIFRGDIRLPAGYNLDNMPKSVKMVTPDNDIIFQRRIEYDKENHAIICSINIEFKNSLYTVDEYPILKEVYKRIFDYLKEPVLLRKK